MGLRNICCGRYYRRARRRHRATLRTEDLDWRPTRSSGRQATDDRIHTDSVAPANGISQYDPAVAHDPRDLPGCVHLAGQFDRGRDDRLARIHALPLRKDYDGDAVCDRVGRPVRKLAKYYRAGVEYPVLYDGLHDCLFRSALPHPCAAPMAVY